MKHYVFASSSQGNCSLITDGKTHLLIDAGISARNITRSLKLVGLSINDIHGVLITHEHSDHISGLRTLCSRHPMRIFASPPVSARIADYISPADAMLELLDGTSFRIGTMTVLPFSTPHDAADSCGYRISSDSIFAIATDMGCLTQTVADGLCGADAVLIEANHDPELLRRGPYPYRLKQRILSPRGHLSNAECGRLAAYLAAGGTRHIILGHLSQTNNTPELALQTVKNCLVPSPVTLRCAPVLGLMETVF